MSKPQGVRGARGIGVSDDKQEIPRSNLGAARRAREAAEAAAEAAAQAEAAEAAARVQEKAEEEEAKKRARVSTDAAAEARRSGGMFNGLFDNVLGRGLDTAFNDGVTAAQIVGLAESLGASDPLVIARELRLAETRAAALAQNAPRQVMPTGLFSGRVSAEGPNPQFIGRTDNATRASTEAELRSIANVINEHVSSALREAAGRASITPMNYRAVEPGTVVSMLLPAREQLGRAGAPHATRVSYELLMDAQDDTTVLRTIARGLVGSINRRPPELTDFTVMTTNVGVESTQDVMSRMLIVQADNPQIALTLCGSGTAEEILQIAQNRVAIGMRERALTTAARRGQLQGGELTAQSISVGANTRWIVSGSVRSQRAPGRTREGRGAIMLMNQFCDDIERTFVFADSDGRLRALGEVLTTIGNTPP